MNRKRERDTVVSEKEREKERKIVIKLHIDK